MSELVIISGISGAGKSQALKVFEDLGYYCVDNVLPQIIMDIANTVGSGSMGEFKKVALVADIRAGELFNGIYSVLDLLKIRNADYKVLFLDAKDEAIRNRYKETRRVHPLARDGAVSEGVAMERKLTDDLKARADTVIDTTGMSVKELKQRIYLAFGAGVAEGSRVHVISFGFKRGIPADCDYVYDARFLSNPFNIDELRPQSGLDRAVAEYVFKQRAAGEFARNIIDMLRIALPEYEREVKTTLVLGIGCTGGRHRSVAVAERVVSLLKREGIAVSLRHRDIYAD